MVISITNITPTHGSRYYAQEGNSSEATQPSEWQGKLATELGLEPGQPIQPESLELLLTGKDPTGSILISKMRVHHEQQNAIASGQFANLERAGIDLTASAPKSVSIQALIFGDRNLELAHQQAIVQMLQILEERYAMTRMTVNGERQKIITGKLLIAQFQHNASRALDPQLHTHNLILNLTQRPGGKWQGLDNEAIYRAKMLLGMIYRNELAREVQALGYAICITHPRHGFWELQGFSAQQLTQFSKRSEQIKEAVGDNASSRQKAKATIFSQRAKKQILPFDRLIGTWRQQAEVAGIQAITPGEPQVHPWKSLWAIAEGLVHRAIAFCSRIANVFRREDLEKAAIREGMGQTSFIAISQTIDQSPELISFRDTKQRLRYITKGGDFHDSVQGSPQRETSISFRFTSCKGSTSRDNSQPTPTSFRSLFANLHLHRRTPTNSNRAETRDIDRDQSRNCRANQSIDEANPTLARGDDQAISAVDDHTIRTDRFFEQVGGESTTAAQSPAQPDATADPDRPDGTTNLPDESAAVQFRQNPIDDWEPSL